MVWSKLVLLTTSIWHTLCQMAPYLLLGFLVAGILSVLVSARFVEKHLGGNGWWPIVKASIFGIPLPLCSCGVIPVAASLRMHGASRGATVSFLVSTPQTGVDSFLVTWSLLGPVFALFRPIAALVSGVVAGLVVMLCGGKETETSGAMARYEEKNGQGPAWRRILVYGFHTLPQGIGKPLLFGILIAALLSSFFPDYRIGSAGQGLSGMLLMLLLAMPIYVCSTGAVPLAAAMIAQGISPGAASVFLLAGPATNSAAIVTLWKILGRRVTLLYIATIAITSLLFGLTLDYLFAWHNTLPTTPAHDCCPTNLQQLSATLLCLIFGYALLFRSRPQNQPDVAIAGKDKLILKIVGMTCSHCAQTVENGLQECLGVVQALVDLEQGQATVWGDGLDVLVLQTKVEKLGYKIFER